ncbi:hypothetical protein V8C86DRAFT_2571076 [Haematococcus lacustris]
MRKAVLAGLPALWSSSLARTCDAWKQHATCCIKESSEPRVLSLPPHALLLTKRLHRLLHPHPQPLTALQLGSCAHCC